MEDRPSWMETIHKNAGWVIALGVIEIILGVIVIFSPFAGGLATTMVFGAILLIGGIARIFIAFGADSFGSGALGFIWGLLVAVMGFYMMTHPGVGLLSLTLVLAALFFASGIIEVIVAFQIKPTKGWGWMLFGGIVSVLLALLVGFNLAGASLVLVGFMVGMHLIFAGLATTTLGSAARSATG